MTVGIVGLGLIGGSFAKAYHETGARVLACNRSRDVLDFAVMSGAVIFRFLPAAASNLNVTVAEPPQSSNRQWLMNIAHFAQITPTSFAVEASWATGDH